MLFYLSVVSILLLYFGYAAIIKLLLKRFKCITEKTAVVIVLGDLGRSPRMQNHASAFSLNRFNVHLIGNEGSACPHHLEADPKITIHYLPDSLFKKLQFLKKLLPFVVYAVLKVTEQTVHLVWCLWKLKNFNVVVIQNPPAVPAVFFVWIITRLRNAYLVIDWHNFGWSILQFSQQKRNKPLVTVLRFFESLCGKLADEAFCVSSIMRKNLIANDQWIGLKSNKVHTLYDRQLPHFMPLPLHEIHHIFCKYFPEQLSSFSSNNNNTPTLLLNSSNEHSTTALQLETISCESVSNFYDEDSNGNNYTQMITLFTEVVSSTNNTRLVRWKKSRPALIITSTSWTVDEDFDLFLKTLIIYDSKASKDSAFPDIVVLITGKGHGQAAFKTKASKAKLRHVVILMLFVPAEDYWKLLASADLGVSLHVSSSGLDLPMKIVDMLSVGLPVLSYKFPAISELLHEGITGKCFSSEQELAELLFLYLANFSSLEIQRFRKSVRDHRPLDWYETWNSVALPIVQRTLLKQRPE